MLLFILPSISRTPNIEDKQPIIEIMPGTSTDVLLTAFEHFYLAHLVRRKSLKNQPCLLCTNYPHGLHF